MYKALEKFDESKGNSFGTYVLTTWSMDALKEAGTLYIQDTAMEVQPEQVVDEAEKKVEVVQALS